MASTAMELPKPTGLLKKRSQVKSACINCRKAKTACSHQRPCNRCETLGISDSCHDVPRKKRGKRAEDNLESSDSQSLHLVDFCKKYLDFKLETEITIQPKNTQKNNGNTSPPNNRNRSPPINCTHPTTASPTNITNITNNNNNNNFNININNNNINNITNTVPKINQHQYVDPVTQQQHGNIVLNESLNSKSINYFDLNLGVNDPLSFIDNSNLLNFNFEGAQSQPQQQKSFKSEQQFPNYIAQPQQIQTPYQEVVYTDYTNLNNSYKQLPVTIQTRFSPESSSPVSPVVDTMTLLSEIERLSKEKESLEKMVNSLSYTSTISAPERFFFSKVALSRWKFDYYCSLDSCSDSFRKLVGRPVDLMRNGAFKCIDLFQPHIRGRTQPLTDLLASGRVSSCSVNQLFYNPKLQKDVLCHSSLQVEFDENGNPTHIVMSSQEFDVTDRDLNFFHAYYVKLRPIKTLPNSLPYPVPQLCGSTSYDYSCE